uniref:Major histocompatibility complex class I UBA n=1 Tax=Astyanax mexicanus TaxID=7994 RepID=A0A3B1K4N9_ASTMX
MKVCDHCFSHRHDDMVVLFFSDSLLCSTSYTAVTSGINFPESLSGLWWMENRIHYDSNTRKIVGEDADYWDTQTQMAQGSQERYKVNVQTLMQRFNHTKALKCTMYGCELDDDGTKRGYMQYGYDGEDFLILDKDTLTWTAPTPQSFISKQKFEKTTEASYQTNYLENTCIEWLQKYVDFGRSVLERKVRPEMDLFQKDSSSPVVCHATGFFPKAVMITWQKNGEDLNEDVDLRETLPNQDGSFQKRSILNVSPEELKNGDKYTCVIQHSSLVKEMVLPVSNSRILPGGNRGSLGVIIGAVVAVLLLVLIGCVGFFILKKKGNCGEEECNLHHYLT